MYLFQSLLDEYKEIWWSTRKKAIPSKIRAYQDKRIVKDNDRDFIMLKRELVHLFTNMDPGQDLTDEDKELIKNRIMSFMSTTMGVARDCCELLDKEGYYDLTIAFMERAKELDETLTFDDIYQALRNVWVMVSLQIYYDQEVVLTDSVFAYSMLYPLTDNYLDDPTISVKEKKTFNQRFYHKIKSNEGEGYNDAEKRIFHMIDLIEKQYSREAHPEVFKSLLAILDGQNKSLDQHGMGTLYDVDLMAYTFYKGGTSVLADAYLVNGKLTKEEALFAYGYGVILQLADDLQDLDEDLANGHHTMINTQARISKLDGFHHHYEAFINKFLEDIFKQDTDKRKSLYALIVISVEQLLLSSILENRKRFSKKHIKHFLSESRFSALGYKRFNKKVNNAIQEFY